MYHARLYLTTVFSLRRSSITPESICDEEPRPAKNGAQRGTDSTVTIGIIVDKITENKDRQHAENECI